MRCEDFRIACEDRPAGAAALSPRLQEHMSGCPACGRWEKERETWGELGSFFREDACVSDTLVLRRRVRMAVAGAGSPRRLWLSPAYGGVAAAALVGGAAWGWFGAGVGSRPAHAEE